MAVRTTAADVATLVEVDAAIDLDAFILTSNELVTELCTDSDYTDTRLELIERWLAAHFYAVRDRQAASERAGSVGQTFMYKVGLNLALTVYGQQAMILDTAGDLAALNKKTEEGKRRTVGVTWLGTLTEEEEDE